MSHQACSGVVTTVRWCGADVFVAAIDGDGVGTQTNSRDLAELSQVREKVVFVHPRSR